MELSSSETHSFTSTGLPIARNIQAEVAYFRDVIEVVFELRGNLIISRGGSRVISGD